MEDRLYKFARLVETGSFTKAALLLHISQPALTTALKKLERELHAELLIRGSHTFRLTTAGQIAYEAAKQLSAQAQNLKTQLAEVNNQKPDLRLGMIDSLAELLFVQGNGLRVLEQSTHLSLTVDNSDRLVGFVEHDDLDLALIANPSELPASILSITLGQEPLILVTHAQRAKQAREDIASGKLSDFLGYNQHSHTYQLVRQYFADQSIELKHSFFSTSPGIMLELVRSKRGVAALPYLLVKPYLEQGIIVPIKLKKSCVIARTIVSVHRSGRSLPSEANNLLARTQSQLTRLMMEANSL